MPCVFKICGKMMQCGVNRMPCVNKMSYGVRRCHVVLAGCHVVIRGCHVVLRGCHVVLTGCYLVLKGCHISSGVSLSGWMGGTGNGIQYAIHHRPEWKSEFCIQQIAFLWWLPHSHDLDVYFAIIIHNWCLQFLTIFVPVWCTASSLWF